jgi:hypothetical protein
MGLFDWLFRRGKPTLEDKQIATGAGTAPVWGTTDDAAPDDSDPGGTDVGGSDSGGFDSGGFDGGGGGGADGGG